MKNKKYFLMLSFILGITILIVTPRFLQANNNYSDALIIPPLLEPEIIGNKKTFHVIAQENTHNFSKNIRVNTYSYGSMSYLGPTIRVKNSDTIQINVENNLTHDTTFHQHGINLPPEADGNIKQVIRKGSTWGAEYTVNQQAGTYWYHPHLLHKTGYQVSQGLAGFLIIDDEESEQINIPHKYGIDDIPIVVQDKDFKSNKISYTENMHTISMGNVGRDVVTNGTISPTFHASSTLIRLRILNGSTFAIHNYRFQDKRNFYLIANDAGLLDKPYALSHIELAPGERREILVDLQDITSRESLALLVNIHNTYTSTALTIVPQENIQVSQHTIPSSMVNYTPISTNEASRTRSFQLGSRAMGMMNTSRTLSINKKQINPNRIDETVTLGDTEIWHIKNIAGGGHMANLVHSFHPHLTTFQVISYNGAPPPPNLRGWKDTILLYPNDEAKIILRFENYTGVYMYHCHQLEHEDAGMMGLFEVIEPI